MTSLPATRPQEFDYDSGSGTQSPTPTSERPPRLPWHLNTRSLTSHLFFGPYIWFPIIASFAWLAALLALLGSWVHGGKKKYRTSDASVLFISDIAGHKKPVFIPLVSVTVFFYVLSLLAERWLRTIDRLPTDIRRRTKVFDYLAMAFGAIGGAALILLAVFDNVHYSRVHWSMTCVFVVCLAFSAIFQFGEVWSLHKDHPDRRSLLRNSIYKLCVIIFAVAGAIAFGSLYAVCRGAIEPHKNLSGAQCNRVTSGAAAMEWTIAFLLFFFFLSLAADLWPAGKSSPRYMRALAQWQERHGLPHDFTGRRAFAAFPERWQPRATVKNAEQAEHEPKPVQEPVQSVQGSAV